ncbi:MAG: long-chain-fatty-acid--CoA ligase [Promethearchaeota archaeon]
MKVIKGFPATTNSNYQLNVTTLIKHAVRNYGRQEIVSRKHDGSLFRYTYSEAYVRMQRLANSLITLGIKAGDIIGVLAWNTYENFEIYFGVPGTGAVMLLLNLRLMPKELIYIINHSKAKFIVVDETLIDIAETVAPECKTVKGYVIITDHELNEIETSLKPIYCYEELLKNASPKFEWPVVDENSAYGACYSSGTTGKPKGVYYSHRGMYLQAITYANIASMSVQDCVFQIVPMFHVMGWNTPHAATFVGAKLVFSGRYSLTELDKLAEILVQEKVTVANGAPAILMPMLEYIKKLDNKPDLTGARLISGASEPPITMMKSFWELTRSQIVHSYGSTEAMAITTLNLPKPWLERDLSEEERWNLKKKQGLIVTGIDVKIIDSNGKELPYDGQSAGEILLRGPWVSSSYFNAPGSENQFTKDGYLKSGDAGTIDPEGFLKITDRIKDVIKSGGEWISSIDMENEILSHPSVLEAAVVGIPHPKWEERPLALVVLREGFTSVKKEDIQTHLAKRFAKWQLPDEILFVSSIPKTSVGKLNKKHIRREYKDLFSRI